MSNELATAQPVVLSLWSKESTQDKIKALMPPSMQWERFQRLTTALIHRNPKLAECEPVSFMACLSDCATIGVYPDPVTGLAYLIPRFNKQKQMNEATLLVGYKGLRSIALRSPDIADLWTGVVRAGDTFRMVRAPKMDLIHEPDPAETGAIIGCYSIARLRNGDINYEWMPLHDLNKIKSAALAGAQDWAREKSPWTLHETEMFRKTVVRRHFKSLPLRAEDQEASEREFDSEVKTVFSDRAALPSSESIATTPPDAPLTGATAATAEGETKRAAAPKRAPKGANAAKEVAGEITQEPAKTPEPEKTEPPRDPAPAKEEAKPGPPKQEPAANAASPAESGTAKTRTSLADGESAVFLVEVVEAVGISAKVDGREGVPTAQVSLKGEFLNLVYHFDGARIEGNQVIPNSCYSPKKQLRIWINGKLNTKSGRVLHRVEKVEELPENVEF